MKSTKILKNESFNPHHGSNCFFSCLQNDFETTATANKLWFCSAGNLWAKTDRKSLPGISEAENINGFGVYAQVLPSLEANIQHRSRSSIFQKHILLHQVCSYELKVTRLGCGLQGLLSVEKFLLCSKHCLLFWLTFLLKNLIAFFAFPFPRSQSLQHNLRAASWFRFCQLKTYKSLIIKSKNSK